MEEETELYNEEKIKHIVKIIKEISIDTEEKFDETEVLNAINDFLRSLSKDNRFILVRRYWFFDSIAEIAERSSISEENVRKILSRLRKRLKEYLKKKVGL